MRNPHGNLLCGKVHMITDWTGEESGPWGVTCGYWRCTDNRCCIRDGWPDKFPMERDTRNTMKAPA